jgi:hypothetical protein
MLVVDLPVLLAGAAVQAAVFGRITHRYSSFRTQRWPGVRTGLQLQNNCGAVRVWDVGGAWRGRVQVYQLLAILLPELPYAYERRLPFNNFVSLACGGGYLPSSSLFTTAERSCSICSFTADPQFYAKTFHFRCIEERMPVRLFLRERRTSAHLPVQSRSEDALRLTPLCAFRWVGENGC